MGLDLLYYCAVILGIWYQWYQVPAVPKHGVLVDRSGKFPGPRCVTFLYGLSHTDLCRGLEVTARVVVV